ncbi:MAG: hypothetical protein ACODAQ_08910 [Phycisphaeraceae bacterium]
MHKHLSAALLIASLGLVGFGCESQSSHEATGSEHKQHEMDGHEGSASKQDQHEGDGSATKQDDANGY